MKYTCIIIIIFLLNACIDGSIGSKYNRAENIELKNAADSGKMYLGSNYIVITENNVDIISFSEKNKDTIHRQIQRGCILEDHPYKYAPKDYRYVSFPEDTLKWFIRKNAPFFRQYARGMRFPVEGIVEGNNSTLSYYDEVKKGFYDIKLKKGDSYYWIILKDGNYVNILPESSEKSLTGALSEKHCNILQKDDYLKIVPEETRRKLEDVWK